MKKLMCLILTIMLMSSAVSALADITLFAPSFNSAESSETLLNSWNEQFDFGIAYEIEPGYTDTVNKLTTMLASGDDSVDVMWIDEIMLLSFSRAGFLAPLERAVSDEDMAGFAPSYVEDFLKYNGSLYAVPGNLALHPLYANMAMFNEAGIAVPTTLDEFIAAAQALTDADKNQYGLVLSLNKQYLQDKMDLFCKMFGGDFYDFADEGTLRAVRFLYDLINTYGVVSKDCLTYDNSAATQAFMDGYGAMIFEWNFTQTLEDAGMFGPDQMSWVPMPTFDTNICQISSWMWVVNANSPNLDQALAFVKSQTTADNQIQFMQATWGDLPALSTAWNDPRVLEKTPNGVALCDRYGQDGSMAARSLSTRHSEYVDVVCATLQRYLLGEISFEDCIAACQKHVERILAAVG